MPKDNQRVVYTTSINADLKKRFQIYCAVKNLYQNEVIEKLIEELLEKEGEGIGNTNK